MENLPLKEAHRRFFKNHIEANNRTLSLVLYADSLLYLLPVEMSAFKKYHHLPQWSLLFAYVFLIGLSILHHHHYNLNALNILADEPVQSASSNDLIQDYTGNCIVHHFTSNLLDYFYSSSEISGYQPPVYDYLILSSFHFTLTALRSSVSLRAPPVA